MGAAGVLAGELTLGAEHVIDNALGVGGTDGLDKGARCEDGEETEGGGAAVVDVAAVKLLVDDLDGLEQETAEAVGGRLPGLALAAMEFGDEQGIAVAPAGDGGAVQAQMKGNGREGSVP